MKIAAILNAALLLSSGVALAASDKLNITPEEHAACDADAIRLCAATYPDEDKMLTCMKANRLQLSRICQVTFAAGLKKRHIPL